MSDKRTKMRQRSLAFRRRLRGEKKNRAVSPVVATLILILIAVAAAAALYLWLVVWQGSVTGGIGTPTAQYTVTIGGSTSVYPFDTYAVAQFEQNNSNVVVSDNQGGSGAGMLAMCAGQVDIGTASAVESVAQLQSPVSTGGYGCPSTPTPVEETVAYDAVDVIVPAANVHGLVSVSSDTLLTVYIGNGGGTSAYTASYPGDYANNGTVGSGAYPQVNGEPNMTALVPLAKGSLWQWDQIPACVAGTAKCGGSSNPEEVPLNTTVKATVAGTVTSGASVGVAGTSAISGTLTLAKPGYDYATFVNLDLAGGLVSSGGGTLVPKGNATIVNENYNFKVNTLFVNFTSSVTSAGATYPTTISLATGDLGLGFFEAGDISTATSACSTGNDLCYAPASGAASPCGWSVCAGGTGPGTGVGQDGATIAQWARSDTSGTEQSFTARILGIGDSLGTTAGLGYSGCSPDGQLASCGINPPAAQLGNGNPGVIAGVAAHPDAIGFASDGLARLASSGVSCDSLASPCIGLEAIGQSVAVTPTTGSSGTIANGILGAGAASAQYQGWRPFEYWTLGAPTGETERFINFVMDPGNNIAFAAESAEVSVYSI